MVQLFGRFNDWVLSLCTTSRSKGAAASRHPDVPQRIETSKQFDYWPVYFCLHGSPWPIRNGFGELVERGGQAWVSVVMTIDFVSLLPLIGPWKFCKEELLVSELLFSM